MGMNIVRECNIFCSIRGSHAHLVCFRYPYRKHNDFWMARNFTMYGFGLVLITARNSLANPQHQKYIPHFFSHTLPIILKVYQEDTKVSAFTLILMWNFPSSSQYLFLTNISYSTWFLGASMAPEEPKCTKN